MENNKLYKAFKNFVWEAEYFFVTKFESSPTIEAVYTDCLDIIYNISGDRTEDQKKGIIAQNPKYGQGKSFFFEVANHRHLRRYKKPLFVFITAQELCDMYTSTEKGRDPKRRITDYINVEMLFIDDIGEELKDGKERSHYGNKLNVIRFVILERYKLWIKKGWRTYGTTNLSMENGDFAENYGGRPADRLLQMCHFKEFRFLETGSFRQVRSTRPLTPDEIEGRWAQIHKLTAKKEETVDKVGYFNELIHEPESYIKSRDISYWGWVSEFLQARGLLKQSDFDKIDEAHLEQAEEILRQEIGAIVRGGMKHASRAIRRVRLGQKSREINRQKVYEAAKNLIARNKFLELRKLKYKFK